MTKKSNIKQSSNVVSESQLLFFSKSNKLILLIKSSKILCENTEVLFIRTCHYMDNIEQFMLSELHNCFNMLTNFKAFLHLVMYKQPK